MYDWHYIHFIDELTEAGHKVTDCNPLEVLGRPTTIAENSQVLVDTAKRVRETPGPHMLLAAIGSDHNLEPSAVDAIKAFGIPCVNLSVDDVTVPHYVRRIGRHFDLHWTTFLGTQETLEGYGCKVIYMPMAANPHFFKRGDIRPDHVMAFVGSRYGARELYIESLAKAGVPMRIRGSGWTGSAQEKKGATKSFSIRKNLVSVWESLGTVNRRKILLGAAKKRLSGRTKSEIPLGGGVDLGGNVSMSEMVHVYASSTASLGVLEAGNTHLLRRPLYHCRLRDFESTMIGCAHVVYRMPELEQAFDEDKEIIFYSSRDECVEKAKFYLSPQRRTLCETVGRNARRRAESDHTWMNRFKKIWRDLGIDQRNL